MTWSLTRRQRRREKRPQGRKMAAKPVQKEGFEGLLEWAMVHTDIGDTSKRKNAWSRGSWVAARYPGWVELARTITAPHDTACALDLG